MNTKFILILLFILIISIHSKRKLLQEKNNEIEKEKENIEVNSKNSEEKEEEEEEEDYTIKKQKKLDESELARSKVQYMILPSFQVLLPIRRIDTSNAEFDLSPCGGVEKKLANTLTSKGSNINFIWEIIVPEYNGNCTVKISKGLQEDKDFKLLKPVNGEINDDGSFMCGREKGFEQKEFKLPDDYECDGCTLQWIWNTQYGNFYSCSDIIINGANLEKCMGKCLNGGSCFNGKCLCLKGFSGEFCEDYEGGSSKTWLWILLIIILIAALCAGFYYYILPWLQKKNPDFVSWVTGKNRSISGPFEARKNASNSLREQPNSDYQM